MRPSNRSKILDAAIRVVHRDGVTGITFESVAAEAGLTRGGMLYRFPSRDALLLGIHEHLANQWEALLEKVAGKPAHEASAEERFAAYVQACAQGKSTRVELQLMLEGATQTALAAPWSAVLSRWIPATPAQEDVVAALWVVRLAADGLWVHQSFSNKALPASLRKRIGRMLLDMIPRSEKSTQVSKEDADQ
ncbi:TPA: TetR/AcrR family transcriptional regulator [Stenotrophomonas maltophilia]